MDNKKIKTELYNDNFQNYKRYNIPKGDPTGVPQGVTEIGLPW